jgi:xylan 1,4-beta-xylosidase
VAGPPAQIILNLSGLGGQRLRVMEYRIDADHSNAYEAWLRMGSPQQPTPEQLSELERASHLALMQSPAWLTPVNGALTLTLDLPRKAVALVVLEQTRS